MNFLHLSFWYRLICTAYQMPFVVLLKTYCFHLKLSTKRSVNYQCTPKKAFKCPADCLCWGWDSNVRVSSESPDPPKLWPQEARGRALAILALGLPDAVASCALLGPWVNVPTMQGRKLPHFCPGQLQTQPRRLEAQPHCLATCFSPGSNFLF